MAPDCQCSYLRNRTSCLRMELLTEARGQLPTEMEEIKPWAQRRPSPCHVQCLCSFLLFWWLPATVERSREREGRKPTVWHQIHSGARRGSEEHCREGITGPSNSCQCLPWWLSWWRTRLQCGRPGFDPWLGRSPGEGKVYPLQYSGLENSMDRIVHGIAKSGHDWATFISLEEDRCSHRTWGYMLLVLSCSVMSNSLQPFWLQLSRLLCPWNFPGKNTGVGCHFLLQGIFPTQESNNGLLCLLHWQVDALPLHHLGSPIHCLLNNILVYKSQSVVDLALYCTGHGYCQGGKT